MPMRLGRLLREPLLHFAMLGFAFFLAYDWLHGASPAQGNEIVITRGRIEQIVAGYERANQRAPLAAELDGLINDAVREEIMYREAMAMGLDRDDTIVRRRLRQKLEFLSEDVAPVPDATDAQLEAYLQAHADRYRNEPRYDLSLVYIDPIKHGSHLADDAATLLARLRRDPGVDLTQVGDQSLLPHHYPNVSAADLTGQFGAEFAKTLSAMQPGAWQGPLNSGLGAHLVLIRRREGGNIPKLSEVRDLVRSAWTDDQRKLANDQYYASLRARYAVTIDRPRTVRLESVPVVATASIQ
jgi:hypothetical protein